MNVPVCKSISAAPALRGASRSQTGSETVTPSESPRSTDFLPASRLVNLGPSHSPPWCCVWVTDQGLHLQRPSPPQWALHSSLERRPPGSPTMPGSEVQAVAWGGGGGMAMYHGWFRVKASRAASPAHGQDLAEPAEFINENRRNQPKQSPNGRQKGHLGG